MRQEKGRLFVVLVGDHIFLNILEDIERLSDARWLNGDLPTDNKHPQNFIYLNDNGLFSGGGLVRGIQHALEFNDFVKACSRRFPKRRK